MTPSPAKATLATDMQLRIYECIDMPSLSSWTVVDEFDLSIIPSPVHTSQGTPTLTSVGLDASAAQSLASQHVPSQPGPPFNSATLNPGAARTPGHPANSATTTPQNTSPADGDANADPDNASVVPTPTRQGLGSREADGGWCLSWCKEKWWGQIMAVACGTSNVLKACYAAHTPCYRCVSSCDDQIIEFIPGQHPITHLELLHEPPDSKGSRHHHHHPHQLHSQPQTLAITSVSWAPSCGRSYHLVATGSRDCMVRIWKLTPPKKVGVEGEDGKWSKALVADFSDHQ